MGITTEDLLLGQSIPNNLVTRIENLERELALFKNAEPAAGVVSDWAADLGDIVAGNLIMGNGVPLGEGFTGMIRAAETIEWPIGSGQLWTDIAFNNDVMTFGVSAIDGKLYGGTGAMVLDENGLIVTGNLFAIKQIGLGSTATSAALGGIVLITGDGNGAAGYAILTGQSTSNSELLTNGDFETGDFTGWTDVGSVAITDSNFYPTGGSTYAAALTLDGGSNSLTSDPASVTSTFPYCLFFQLKYAASTPRFIKVVIRWYNSTPTLIQTDTYTLSGGALVPQTDWKGYLLYTKAATTATTATIAFEDGGGSSSGTFYIDQVSLRSRNHYGLGVVVASNFIFGVDDTHGPTIGIGFEDHDLTYTDMQTLQTGHVHYGDYVGYSTYNNDNTERIVSTWTIKANSLGLNGTFFHYVAGDIFNNSGSARNVRIRAYLGGTGGTLIYDSGAISVNAAGREWPWRIYISGANVGATNAQSIQTKFEYSGNGFAATAVGPIMSTPLVAQVNSTVDTTSDQDLVVTTLLAVANTSLISSIQHVRSDGPINA